jgi:hypothetical protein
MAEPAQTAAVQEQPASSPTQAFNAAATPPDIDLKRYGLLLPSTMPEDPEEAEAVLAEVAEYVAARLAKQTPMAQHQVDQIINQFSAYDEGKPDGARYTDMFAKARAAERGTFDPSASVYEISRARVDLILKPLQHEHAIEGFKRRIEERADEIIEGGGDPAVKDTIMFAADPEGAFETFGDTLKREQVLEAYGLALAGNDVETIMMDDGRSYALFEMKDEEGGRDFVLMSNDDLEIKWHQTYLGELLKVTPYGLRQVSQEALDELEKISDQLVERELPAADRLALQERQNKIFQEIRAGEHQAGVSLKGLSGIGSLGGHVHRAEQELEIGQPDVVLAQRNLNELNPSLQAAILRHQGNEQAAEALEKTIRQQPEQAPTPDAAPLPPGS